MPTIRSPFCLTIRVTIAACAGITTAAFPKTIRLGGIDCAATYLHEPGNPQPRVISYYTLPRTASDAPSER